MQINKKKTNPLVEKWSKNMSWQSKGKETQMVNNQRTVMGIFAAIKRVRLTCIDCFGKLPATCCGTEEVGYETAGRGSPLREMYEGILGHILVQNIETSLAPVLWHSK